MKSFYRGFTDGLSRRFRAPSDDIAPKSFDTDSVKFVSDIERKLQNSENLCFNIDTVSVPFGTSKLFNIQYALRPFNPAVLNQQWIYPLDQISAIRIRSITASLLYDRGVGGTGTYNSEFRVLVGGTTLGVNTQNCVYVQSTSFAVGAGVAASLHQVHPTDAITIYHGDSTFLVTDSGLLTAFTEIVRPQFIVFQYRFAVPSTAADVTLREASVVFNVDTTFVNNVSSIEYKSGIVI